MYMSALAIVRPQLQTGKIKLLAVTNSVRAPTEPNVPTVKEAGHGEVTFDCLVGLFGPPEMSKELRERIAAAIQAVVAAAPVIGDRPRRHRPTPQRWRAGRVRTGDRGATREDRRDCQGPRHQADAVMSP